MSNIAITGAPPPSPAPADGSVPLRREIRDLQANYPDQWNLYILGLEAFKANDETFELSYYEIAGIHGRPYRPWGGVQGANRGGWQGYCTHSSILFAPWHRPYLALFEQTLYRIIQAIAAKFPADSRARYQQAAATFRIPYWDWAAAPPSGDNNFPNVVGTDTIDVVDTTGQTVQKPNPLYSFTFHPILKNDFAPLGGAPFQEWPVTLRYPTDFRDPNATSQEDQVVAALSTQFDSLQGNVNILLNDPSYQDFSAFSNHAWENNEPSTFASLEDIHNSIHGAVGGNLGHMAEIDYAAFDPVFWLHHANVDRLFAIWQALNPNSYTIDKRSNQNDGGTFAIREGSLELATTGLAPFYDQTGTKFWDSLGVRTTEAFNYAYPETQQWKFSSTSDYQNSILGTVQQLYGSFGNQFAAEDAVNLMSTQAVPQAIPETVHQTTIRTREAIGPAGGSQHPIAEAAPAPKPAPEEPQAAPHTGFHPFRGLADRLKGHHNNPGNNPERGGLDLEAEIGKPSPEPVPVGTRSYTEYIVNLKAPKHILQQTYRVHVFLGEFDSDLATWNTQHALQGTFTVFGRNTVPGGEEETGCGKCKKDAEDGLIVTGTIPLTKALIHEVKEGNCPSLAKENVLPWLRQNLHWRVTLADGTEKDRSEVPGLVVTVVTTEVELPPHGFPRFSGVYVSHPEVTAGRPAGAVTST